MYLRRSRSYLFTRTTLLNTAPFEPVQPSDVARFFLLRRLLSVHNADYLVASENLAISPCSAFISGDLIVHMRYSDACTLPYRTHRLPPIQEFRLYHLQYIISSSSHLQYIYFVELIYLIPRSNYCMRLYACTSIARWKWQTYLCRR